MKSEIDDVDLVFYGIAIVLAMTFLFIAMKATPVPPLLGQFGAFGQSGQSGQSGQAGQAGQAGQFDGQAVVPPKPNREVLTRLINVGATFYGASWCGFTKKQLAELGITEKETHGLDYVSCEEHEQLCSDKGIEAFPTWQINGQTYPGYYPPEKLLDLVQKS